MKISLLDPEKLIAVNKLRECTSSKIYGAGKGMRDPHGIVSEEIFGLSRQDRKSTFAYIDLKIQYIHPHVYSAILSRMCQPVVHLVSGQKKYKIVDGYFREDEGGWTGIEQLYAHWPEIDWSKSTSKNVQSIKLLKLTPRNQIFMGKLIITPPGYRDILPSGSGGSTSDINPEINKMYTSLINRVNATSQGGILRTRYYPLQAAIQNILVKVYNEHKKMIEGKGGYIKRFLLGKSISYGTRSVIAAPSYNNETLAENLIDIEHMGLPIAQCLATFKPFIEAWVKNFFQREIVINQNIVRFVNTTNGKEVSGSVLKPESQFSDREIDRIITNFVRNPDSRFRVITVEIELPQDPGRELETMIVNLSLKGKEVLPNNQLVDLKRPLTVTDILYLASVDTCERRHVMVSRYPVGTDKGIFLSKIRVESTQKKVHVIFNGKDYPFYPVVDLATPKDLVGIEFIDTTRFSNSLLKGMGKRSNRCPSKTSLIAGNL